MDNQNPPPAPSAPPQSGGIRSRITVVCAECKRLKLKCDRRTPCSSCVKRDTVSKCQYSAAAAEKIDVQSLHNRVCTLESAINQLTSGQLKVRDSSNDRALMAVGSSGSSVIISLDDVAGVWLEQLDLVKDVDLRPVEPDLPEDPSTVPSDIFPNLQDFRNSAFEPFSVTPALLAMLPAEPSRDALMKQFESTMLMHPCFNFPHFRQRVNNLFAPESDEKPTLSFFAAAAAGFALGAQAWLEANRMSVPGKARASFNPEQLWALSKQSLAVFESTNTYDLDYLIAMILQTLFLLHDGKARIAHTLFPAVGKMVNIARMMGLPMDPDEQGKYSLYEAEMRRRVWWDIYYYDLFVSDYMGMAPSIADDSHTCRLPSDVDEEAFKPLSTTLPPPGDLSNHSHFGYFIQKCKLAQLVKSMKKRNFRDAGRDTSSTDQALEAAMQSEVEIATWLADLPQQFKLDMESDNTGMGASPFLIAQRCELASLANQLVIKLFNPFIKRSKSPAHHATLACVNAAHTIIHASRVLHSVFKSTRPSAYLFYSFGRHLFLAAIITAHAVIQNPQNMIAKAAMLDLRLAVELMRDPVVSTGRGSSRGVEGTPSEALRLVELLLSKAETSIAGGSAVTAGTKRKHSDLDDGLHSGFHLPFVGAAVATVSPRGSNSTPASASSPVQPRSRAPTLSISTNNMPAPPPVWSPASSEAPSHRDRASTKSHPYPAYGIRVRNGSSREGRSRGHSVAGSSRSGGTGPPPSVSSSLPSHAHSHSHLVGHSEPSAFRPAPAPAPAPQPVPPPQPAPPPTHHDPSPPMQADFTMSFAPSEDPSHMNLGRYQPYPTTFDNTMTDFSNVNGGTPTPSVPSNPQQNFYFGSAPTFNGAQNYEALNMSVPYPAHSVPSTPRDGGHFGTPDKTYPQPQAAMPKQDEEISGEPQVSVPSQGASWDNSRFQWDQTYRSY